MQPMNSPVYHALPIPDVATEMDEEDDGVIIIPSGNYGSAPNGRRSLPDGQCARIQNLFVTPQEPRTPPRRKPRFAPQRFTFSDQDISDR